MPCEKPLLSIIVPVYDVERYLPKCIDSVLAQTFTDFDLIVVEDGSPDNCPALCDAAAKENRPAWTEKRLAYGAQCSWTERVHQMEEVLYKKGVLHESAEE